MLEAAGAARPLRLAAAATAAPAGDALVGRVADAISRFERLLAACSLSA